MNEFVKIALKADASDLKAGFHAATTALSTFQKGLGKVRSFVKSVEDQMKTMGRRALGFSATMAGAITVSTTAAVSFESEMRNVNSILYETETQFQNTGDAVLKMSTEIPKAATDLAGGLYDIASSGFDGAEGLQILQASGVAATAGMTDTATAAKAISGAINTWSLSAADATDVADILFKTVESGVVTFEELALNMSDFTGVAQAAGLQLDEVSAAYAALTLSGMPASRAATALASALNKVIKPSDALSEAVAGLGYESALTMVQQLGMKDALLALSDSVDGNVSAMAKMFDDVEGLRGVLALTTNNGELFATALDDIANKSHRAGAAANAYAEQSKSVSVKIDQFKNMITALRIEIGRYYLPILGAVLDKGIGVAQFFNDLPAPIHKLVAVFMALSTVMSAIVGLMIASAIRTKLFKIAMGSLKEGTKSYAVAQKLGVLNAKSFTGALIGMSTASRKAALAARAGETVQRKWAVTAGAAATGTQKVSTAIARLAGVTSRGTATQNSMAAATGRTSAALLSMSSRVGGLSARIGTMSANAAAGSGRFSLMASRMRLVERTTLGAARAFQALKARMGLITTAAFAVIDIMQSWSATANQAKESAKSLREEVEQGYDTSTLEGMRDSYAELYGLLEEKSGKTLNIDNGALGGGVEKMASTILGMKVSLQDLKGGLEALSPFNDNNVQKSRQEIIGLAKELENMTVQYDRAMGVVDGFTSAVNVSDQEAEKLAQSLGVDLRDGTKYSVAELQRIAQTKTPAELRAMADETGDVAIQMLAAAHAVSDNSFELSGLGEQLKSLHTPFGTIIGDTIELTDAQKELQRASQEIGSFGTALTDALQAEKDKQQEIVDQRIKELEKASSDEIDSYEEASRARINAEKDRVQAMKSGSDEQKAAQKRLEALRESERKSLKNHRESESEILDQQRDDLKKTVDEQELSLKEMTDALINQNAKLSEWKRNLVVVAGRTSKEVADYLASMGTDGVDLVAMMATGSEDEVQDMKDAIVENMKLTGSESAIELDTGMTLAERAARLGAKATKDAVLEELGVLPSDVTGVMRDYGQAIEDGLNVVLSGMGKPKLEFDFVPKVWTKQESELARLESKYGGVYPVKPDIMGPVKQRALGGIDTPAQIARQPTVLFGERSTGGEAYIPLGANHRAMSIKIWERTGQYLGVIPMASGGLIMPSGGTQVTKTSVSKKSETIFTGDMYLSDPTATLRYAERRKRMAALRGVN